MVKSIEIMVQTSAGLSGEKTPPSVGGGQSFDVGPKVEDMQEETAGEMGGKRKAQRGEEKNRRIK